MPSRITQKGDKIYGIRQDSSVSDTYIFELKTDGSGTKIVYSFPEDDGIEITNWACHAFPEQVVWYYNYLNEFGAWNRKVLSVREDEDGKMIKQTLYEETSEELEGGMFANAQGILGMRGNDIVLCGFVVDEEEVKENTSLNSTNLLVRVGETALERIGVSEEIDLYGAYIGDDSYIYYKKNEGFYQMNIQTEEKTLLFESTIQDARGFILNEDYMIECNRYYENKPENPCFRFYNGKEWKEVELPENVKNSDKTFAPIGVASDKMFFNHAVEINGEAGTNWYYLTINDKNPKFVYIGDVAFPDEEENSSVEQTEESISNETEENNDFEEIVVFDNEDCLLKITKIYMINNECYVNYYAENRRKDGFAQFIVQECSINGIQCNPQAAIMLYGGKVSADNAGFSFQGSIDTYNISKIYKADEYTKIEIGFRYVNTSSSQQGEKIITYYPKGEENVVTYTREPLDTDIVLVDNEYVSVILTGYEKGYIENDTLNVYLVNKTDQLMYLDVSEAILNKDYIFKSAGMTEEDFKELEEMKEMENVTQAGETLFYFTLNPNACGIYKMTLFAKSLAGGGKENEFLVSKNITNIEEIGMMLRVVSDYSADGEIFFYDTITLNP